MKLELKHLAPYLPYGLRVPDGLIECLDLRYKTASIYYDDPVEGAAKFGSRDIKRIEPILRPLSDLTKEIEINGERFVPLERLFSLLDTSEYVDYCGGFDHPKTQVDDGWNHVLTYEEDNERLEFGYFENGGFHLWVNGECQSILNQIDLFEWLYQHHFDVFGLINEGLAIDINTIK